jgi:hypothetical protein
LSYTNEIGTGAAELNERSDVGIYISHYEKEMKI